MLFVRGDLYTPLYKKVALHNRGGLQVSKSDLRFYGLCNSHVRRISKSFKYFIHRSRKMRVSRICSIHTSANGDSTAAEHELMVAIFLEVQSGFDNVQGRTMRFSKFLYSKIMSLLPALRYKSHQVRLEDIMNYEELATSERSKLLDKVSLLFGFSNARDLVGHISASRDSAFGLSSGVLAHNHIKIRDKEPNSSMKRLYHNILEDLRKFPAISLGISPHVELYDITQDKMNMDIHRDNLEVVLAARPADKNSSESWKKDPESVTYSSAESQLDCHAVQSDKVHHPSDNLIMEETEIPKANKHLKNSETDMFLELFKPYAQSTTMGVLEKEVIRSDERCRESSIFNMNAASLSNNKPTEVNSGAPKLSSDKRDQKSAREVNKEINKSWTASSRLDTEQVSPSCCFLDVPIKLVDVLSPRQRKQLEDNGFYTVRKLLNHFPRTYIGVQDTMKEFEDGRILNITGKVLSSRGFKANAGFGIVEVVVACEIPIADADLSDDQNSQHTSNVKTVYLHLKRFLRGKRFANYFVLKKIESLYHSGDTVSVYGKIKALESDKHFEIQDFIIKVIDEKEAQIKEKEALSAKRPETDEKVEILPVYPSKGDCGHQDIAKCIKIVLQCLPVDMEPFPEDICHKFGLMNLSMAYFSIHSPKDIKNADSGRRRFIFDDFFYLQLGLLFQRYNAVHKFVKSSSLSINATGFETGYLDMHEWSELSLKVVKSLPFSLTDGQLRVSSEILWDLRRPIPMSRLLVGDVGSGKTVVALLAALEVIDSGYQAAFMVPTEMLAAQHYKNVVFLLQEIESTIRPSVALLTGSTSLKDAHRIRMELKSGDISLVVGTHSLISETVEFKNLCLAVIDEQQRFGVRQKESFSSKGFTIANSIRNTRVQGNQLVEKKVFLAQHVLVMTATPIPRTLALSLHGDMSLSLLKDIPPGRKAVKTLLLERDVDGIKEAYKMVEENLAKGGRVFIVYPFIEECKWAPDVLAMNSEISKISSRFDGYRCNLVHGQMKPAEREVVMQDFKEGKTQILLATSVIEVGVDIPEATMIVIMHGERFGISQLHQLRGRVGRGSQEAMCIILSSPCSLERLKILQHGKDGFELAEADLKHRGSGALLGTEQSGHLLDFSVARLETDGGVLDEARSAALEIIGKNEGLDSSPKLKAELSMRFNGFTSRV